MLREAEMDWISTPPLCSQLEAFMSSGDQNWPVSSESYFLVQCGFTLGVREVLNLTDYFLSQNLAWRRMSNAHGRFVVHAVCNVLGSGSQKTSDLHGMGSTVDAEDPAKPHSSAAAKIVAALT